MRPQATRTKPEWHAAAVPSIWILFLLHSAAASASSDVLRLEFTSDEILRAGTVKIRIDTHESPDDALFFNAGTMTEDAAAEIVELINDEDGPFRNSRFFAEVDAENPKRIFFRLKPNSPQTIGSSFRVWVVPRNPKDTACVGLEHCRDPSPPITLSLQFFPTAVAGFACDNPAPSTIAVFANNETIELPLSPGESADSIVERLEEEFTARGYAVRHQALRLEVLNMPDGAPVVDLGTRTDDPNLLEQNPALLATASLLAIPTLSRWGILALIMSLALVTITIVRYRKAGG